MTICDINRTLILCPVPPRPTGHCLAHLYHRLFVVVRSVFVVRMVGKVPRPSGVFFLLKAAAISKSEKR